VWSKSNEYEFAKGVALKLVHEIRLSAIRASIWQREAEAGPRYSVSISRIYPSASHPSTSGHFEVGDLPLIAEVVDLAHLWIYEQAELIV